MAAVSQETTAQAARRLNAAHDALRRDTGVQFDLRAVDPPPPPPAWLKAVGEWIEWALRPVGRALAWIFGWLPDAPYARALFWVVIAIAAAGLVWLVIDRVRHGRWWRYRRRADLAATDGEEDVWTPDAAPARAWLREADALAAQGRFAEAIHHLLLRSIDDIAQRRPRLVRPALTARDIAQAEAIPSAARSIFGDIAALVERSLFGGRALAADDWAHARDRYARFALAEAWA